MRLCFVALLALGGILSSASKVDAYWFVVPTTGMEQRWYSGGYYYQSRYATTFQWSYPNSYHAQHWNYGYGYAPNYSPQFTHYGPYGTYRPTPNWNMSYPYSTLDGSSFVYPSTGSYGSYQTIEGSYAPSFQGGYYGH
jgi:hypothetical protein